MGINKAEKEHLGKVAALGCNVCHHEGRFGVSAEVHHIRQGAGMGGVTAILKQSRFARCTTEQGNMGWRFMQGRRWQELYGYERDLLKEVMGMIWTRLIKP